jgi:hypothetical protein
VKQLGVSAARRVPLTVGDTSDADDCPCDERDGERFVQENYTCGDREEGLGGADGGPQHRQCRAGHRGGGRRQRPREHQLARN